MKFEFHGPDTENFFKFMGGMAVMIATILITIFSMVAFFGFMVSIFGPGILLLIVPAILVGLAFWSGIIKIKKENG